MNAENKKPKPGEMVVLAKIPTGLLDGLRTEDQAAIAAIVGKPVLLSEYDDIGRAELEFKDEHGVIHLHLRGSECHKSSLVTRWALTRKASLA